MNAIFTLKLPERTKNTMYFGLQNKSVQVHV